MRQNLIVVFAAAVLAVVWSGHPALAGCTVPNNLTNGTTADASQVMANFNAVTTCVNSAPAGSTNAVQINAGSGALGGVGPLTNGQLVVGSTGAAPQATTLTAGTGISITNGAGAITIASTGGPSSSLFDLSEGVPAASSFTALNLSSGTTLTDQSPKALYMTAGTSVNNHLNVEYKTCPATTPYRIAILAQTLWVGSNNWAFFGWRDNSSGKLQILGVNNGGVFVQSYNSPTSFTSQQTSDTVPQGLIWVGLHDDGTNVYFEFSEDGVNFTSLYTVAKSSGFLGSSGYNACLFGVFDNNGGLHTALTVRVWDENGISRSFP